MDSPENWQTLDGNGENLWGIFVCRVSDWVTKHWYIWEPGIKAAYIFYLHIV